MPVLPQQPLLHRSWLLRGQFSPSPWAKSMSGLLEETEVTFYRASSARTISGGRDATDVPVEFLTAQCHVELEENEVKLTEPAPAIIVKRNWWLSMGVPADPSTLPVRGDRVRFYDPAGRLVDTVLAKADVTTEGVLDHVEMASESWE